MPKLKCIEGEHLSRDFPLGAKPLLLGRRTTNAIVLEHVKASRSHAEIGVHRDQAYVKDLNSSNGTYLNGVKIQPEQMRYLSPGDEVRVAHSIFRYFDSETTLPAVEIPGHELIEVIAEGGMGTIYKARQTSMDREVAVKILHPEYAERKEFVNRFIQEARSAGKLNHPNIIQVHNVGKAGAACYYFTMELVRGGNLSQRMGRGDLDTKQILEAAVRVSDALEYAHERGIIHCDIKPENIILADSGEIKLADLGIAKIGQTKDEDGRKVLGTPHYMSPEQAQGRAVDGRSDLYSLGATLFHALGGEPMFGDGDSREIMSKQVQAVPRPLGQVAPDLPEAVTQIVDRLLQKDPSRRFQTAGELKAALEKTIQGLNEKPAEERPTRVKTPQTKAAPRAGTRPRPRAGQEKMKNAVAAGVVLIVLAVVLAKLTQGDGLPEPANPAGAAVAATISEDQAETLESLQALVQAGDLLVARERLTALIETERNQTLVQQAALMLGDVNRLLAVQRDEQQAQETLRRAWEEYEGMRTGSPEDFIGQRGALERIRGAHPDEGERVDQELARIAQAERNLSDNALRDLQGKAQLGQVDQVLSAIERFRRDHPDAPGLDQLQAIGDRARQDAEGKLSTLKASVEKARQDGRLEQMLPELLLFQNNVQYAPAMQEVARLRREIEDAVSKRFADMNARVREHLAKFSYVEARNALALDRLTFFGTQYDAKTQELDQVIGKLEALHAAAVTAIQGSRPWQVPGDSALKSMQGKAIIGATRDEIRLKVGPATTKQKWVDLTPQETLVVYEHYVPPSAPERAAMQVYRQMFAR